MPESLYRLTDGAILLRTRVQPRARRPGIAGRMDDADGPRLKIAVTAPPEDGRANDAVCETVALALGIARSAVSVTAGAASRSKVLRIGGDAVALAERIDAL